MMDRLLIFDLDGTLIDSVPDLTMATNFALAQVDLPPLDEGVLRAFVGNGTQALIERAIGHYTNDDRLCAVALDYFLAYYQQNVCVKTTLYHAVKTGLQQLVDAGFVMAIVTNKPMQFVTPILQTLQIAHFFEIIIGGDSLDAKKPDPKPLLFVCEQLKIHPRCAVMIGDSKNDILAGKNANISTMAVSYGYNYNQPIKKYDPDYVFDDFGALVAFLLQDL